MAESKSLGRGQEKPLVEVYSVAVETSECCKCQDLGRSIKDSGKHKSIAKLGKQDKLCVLWIAELGERGWPSHLEARRS